MNVMCHVERVEIVIITVGLLGVHTVYRRLVGGVESFAAQLGGNAFQQLVQVLYLCSSHAGKVVVGSKNFCLHVYVWPPFACFIHEVLYFFLKVVCLFVSQLLHKGRQYLSEGRHDVGSTYDVITLLVQFGVTFCHGLIAGIEVDCLHVWCFGVFDGLRQCLLCE